MDNFSANILKPFILNLELTRIVSSSGLSFVASKVASKDPGKDVPDACYTVIENV